MATTTEAPAAPVTPEIPVQVSEAAPVVVAKDEPAVEPVVEAAAETETETPAAPESKVPPKLPDWAQKRFDEKAFEARENARKLKAAEEELARLKSAAPASPTPADAANVQQPAGGFKTQADFDAAVQAEANNRVNAERVAAEQQAFNDACNAAYVKGKTDNGENFDLAVQNLQQVGAMQKDMLDIVLATDDPAKVLYELGSDPDRAARLVSMTPAQRAMEIAKMSVPSAKAATPLSKAPRPVETVEGSARPNASPQDNDDDATWFAKRNAEVAARARAG